jgi:hypothetical protein
MLKNSPKARNPRIGTTTESSLHRSLKFRYSSEGSTEILAGGFICDGCTEKGELIEVQTGTFAPLREKVKILTRKNKVRIVHPIIARKTIELYDTSGCLISKSKSPKKGSIWDLFTALIHAPELPLTKNLRIELAVVEIVEKRVDDEKGSWRRKYVSISDRCLVAWLNSVELLRPKDYYQFVPFKKDEQFTTRELGEKAGIRVTLARKTLYVLTRINLVERVGKRGNALVYQRRTMPCMTNKKHGPPRLKQ